MLNVLLYICTIFCIATNVLSTVAFLLTDFTILASLQLPY
jgi:hypothetical protein